MDDPLRDVPDKQSFSNSPSMHSDYDCIKIPGPVDDHSCRMVQLDIGCGFLLYSLAISEGTVHHVLYTYLRLLETIREGETGCLAHFHR